jgi:hypothetical protein
MALAFEPLALLGRHESREVLPESGEFADAGRDGALRRSLELSVLEGKGERHEIPDTVSAIHLRYVANATHASLLCQFANLFLPRIAEIQQRYPEFRIECVQQERLVLARGDYPRPALTPATLIGFLSCVHGRNPPYRLSAGRWPVKLLNRQLLLVAFIGILGFCRQNQGTSPQEIAAFRR